MVIDSIAHCPLFEGTDAGALEELSRRSEEMRLEAGAALFREGEPGDALYLVLEGGVEVTVETSSGDRYRLNTVMPGEWLGENSVLSGKAHSAAATATQASALLRIPASALAHLFAQDPSARKRMGHATLKRLPSHHLRVNAMFAAIDPEHLHAVDTGANWVRLRGGDTLFQQGEPSDALYVVIHGNVEVLVADGAGERLVEVAGRGACLGEMGLLAGESRTASVRAIRDCELVRITYQAFEELVQFRPELGMSLARTLAARLKKTNLTPRLTRDLRTIAVVPDGHYPLPPEFMARLMAALAVIKSPIQRIGLAEIAARMGSESADSVLVELQEEELQAWLAEQEATNRLVVYECDPDNAPWNQRALRQVDLVLVVGRGELEPAPGALEQALQQGIDLSRVRRELIVSHADERPPRGTEKWLQAHAVARHHQLRLACAGDYARVARSLCGTALGVALSGGGARGFSHIGAVQALRDHGLEIDVIGGTSMGSVIAAQVAMGWDTATMIERNRKAFVECAVLGDMTFPYISVMKGGSTMKLLRDLFGEIRIEDLWLPYFCVSTNLSRAQVVVHERGPLSLWVRASSSVPGIGPPVPWQGELLVDGGLLNNLPADVMRERCPGIVVACDASPAVELTTQVPTRTEMSGWPHLWRLLNPWARREPFPNLLEILTRTASMSSDHSSGRVKAAADLYLHPPVDNIGALDWGSIERIVEIGYRHACSQIDAWQASAKGSRSVATVVTS